MAFSQANITTLEQEGFDNDCPLLIGRNILSNTVIDQSTFSTASSNPSSVDQTTSFTPLSRVYDGLLDTPCVMESYAAYQGAGGYAYLSFKFDPSIAFDTAIIAGHNAVTERFDEVDIIISDALDNTTGEFVSPEVVAKRTIVSGDTTNLRMAFMDLRDLDDTSVTKPQKYSGVDYLSVRWSNNNRWFAPRIGELVLGKRRQLRHQPQMSWGDKDAQSFVSNLETNNGNRFAYTMSKFQAIRRARITLSSDDEVSAVESWWADTNYGKESFWWVETPSSNPQAYYMKATNPKLDFAQTKGSDVRVLSLDMVEQRPFLSWEKLY